MITPTQVVVCRHSELERARNKTSNVYRAAYALVLCGVLAALALSHANGGIALVARKNYCSFFSCWTQSIIQPKAVASDVGSKTASAAAQLDTAQIEALTNLAPASSAVTAAAATLKGMLDPLTTSIILKAQDALDQSLAQGQLKRLNAPTAALNSKISRPVTLLAHHLVNMEKGLLSQEQELMRDEQGLPYETRSASSAQAPAALPATLRDSENDHAATDVLQHAGELSAALDNAPLQATLRDAAHGALSSQHRVVIYLSISIYVPTYLPT